MRFLLPSLTLSQPIFGCPSPLDEKRANLETTILELRTVLADSQHNADAHIQQLRTELNDSQQKIDSLTRVLRVHQLKDQCETLYADGHAVDTAQLLLEIVKTASEDVTAGTIIVEWLSGELGH